MIDPSFDAMLRELNREPSDFEDAKRLIDQLKEEIKRRPQMTLIERDKPQTVRGADVLPTMPVTTSGIRVELTFDSGKYVFQSCVLVENPDTISEVTTHRDNEGNVMVEPTMCKPKD